MLMNQYKWLIRIRIFTAMQIHYDFLWHYAYQYTGTEKVLHQF
jgi:hypothetical protein